MTSTVTYEDIIKAATYGKDFNDCTAWMYKIITKRSPPFISRNRPYRVYMSDYGIIDVVTAINVYGLHRSDTIPYIKVSIVMSDSYVDNKFNTVYNSEPIGTLCYGARRIENVYIYANRYKTTKIHLSRYSVPSEPWAAINDIINDHIDVI